MVLSDRDRLLIASCVDGSPGAWEEFVDSYLPLITHVVNKCLASRGWQTNSSLRDDLVAEVLLNIVDNQFAALRRFRGQSSLGTYLVVLSRRVAVRALAKQVGAAPVRGPEVAVDQADPSGADLSIEDVEEVETMLDKLPNEQATVVRLYHLEHKSYTDISSSTGIPENSIGPLLSRARESMRQMRRA